MIKILTTSYPKSPTDYAGCFVAEMAERFCAFTPSVEVIYPIFQPTSHDTTEEHHLKLNPYQVKSQLFEQQGAPDWLENHPLAQLIEIPKVSLSLMIFLNQILKSKRQDECIQTIWIAHWLLPNALALALLNKDHHLKIVAYVHGGDLALLEKMPFRSLIARFLLERINRFIFVSDDLKKRFETLLNQPTHELPFFVKPMGVYRPKLDLFAKHLYESLKGKRKCITSIGRLVPIKGLSLLATALGAIKDQIPPFCWLIAGDGPEQRKIQVAAESAGLILGHDFVFLGRISASQREALLSVSDLFVLSSIQHHQRTEGMPVSLLEAICANVPVLASHCGGVAEILDAQYDLFKAGNLEDLKIKILGFFRDHHGYQQSQLNRLAHLKNQFLWENIIKDHWTLCQITSD
jgi:glycosyltransferase involved in cell wall biosynthesis